MHVITITCTSEIKLFRYCASYQEGMDILMFKDTGMVGLQS